MRLLGNGTSNAMAAEVDHLNLIFPTGFLDGRNVLVPPTPELDMPKAGGGDTRNFFLGQKVRIQGI